MLVQRNAGGLGRLNHPELTNGARGGLGKIEFTSFDAVNKGIPFSSCKQEVMSRSAL